MQVVTLSNLLADDQGVQGSTSDVRTDVYLFFTAVRIMRMKLARGRGHARSVVQLVHTMYCCPSLDKRQTKVSSLCFAMYCCSMDPY